MSATTSANAPTFFEEITVDIAVVNGQLKSTEMYFNAEHGQVCESKHATHLQISAATHVRWASYDNLQKVQAAAKLFV